MGGEQDPDRERLDEAWLRVAGQRGVVGLRPLTIGELLDGAFAVVRTRPVLLMGTAAVLGAIATLLTAVPRLVLLAMGRSGADDTRTAGESFLEGLTSVVLGVLVLALTATVAAALLAPLVSDAALGRERSGAALRALWRRRWARVLVLVLLMIVGLLAGLLPAAAGALLVAFGQPVAGGILLGLGLAFWVLGVVPVIAGRWSPAVPTLLTEDLGAVAALSRSWRLTRGSFWRVLWVQLVAWIMVLVSLPLLTVPTEYLSGFVGDPEDPSVTLARAAAGQAVLAVGEVGAQAVLLPFLACLLGLIHLDLRLRREGLAVRLLRDLGRRGGRPGQGPA